MARTMTRSKPPTVPTDTASENVSWTGIAHGGVVRSLDISFGGVTYEFCIVRPPLTHEQEYRRGMCDSETSRAYVVSNLTPSNRRKTGWHEVAHAAMFEYSIGGAHSTDVTQEQFSDLVALMISCLGIERIAEINAFFSAPIEGEG